MPEENFSSLIPQQGDTPEILRVKHAQAAARLVEPAAANVTVLQFYAGGGGLPLVDTPTYFRKAIIWGGTRVGGANTCPIRLTFLTNSTRLIFPNTTVTIEALPGQKLNLQDFSMSNTGYADFLTFELY